MPTNMFYVDKVAKRKYIPRIYYNMVDMEQVKFDHKTVLTKEQLDQRRAKGDLVIVGIAGEFRKERERYGSE